MFGEVSPQHEINLLFTRFVEAGFSRADEGEEPEVVRYLSALMVRFLHRDQLLLARALLAGGPHEIAAALAAAAGSASSAEAALREAHRQLGDTALFWTGVYPEMIRRIPRRPAITLGGVVDTGRREYALAAAYQQAPFEEEAPTLARLSSRFEAYVAVLRGARCELEQHASPEMQVVARLLAG